MIGKAVLVIVFLQLSSYAIGAGIAYDEGESDDYDDYEDINFDDDDDIAMLSEMSPEKSLLRDLLYLRSISKCKIQTPNEGTSIHYKVYAKCYRKWRCYLRFKCWLKSIAHTTHQFNDNGDLFTKIPTQTTDSGVFFKRRIERFNIQCPDGHFCMLSLINVCLPAVNTETDRICLDYVEVKGVQKLCENDTLVNHVFHENIVVTFQHGLSTQKQQLELHVLAVNPNLVTVNSCLQQSNKDSLNDYEENDRASKKPIPGTIKGDFYGGYNHDRELFRPNEDYERERDMRIPGGDEEKLVRYFEEREGYNNRDRGENDREQFRPNEDYQREREMRIPEGAEEKLVRFYVNNNNNVLAYSTESYNNILSLAVISESSSCELSLVAIAQRVISLFPKIMVTQAKLQAMNSFYNKK